MILRDYLLSINSSFRYPVVCFYSKTYALVWFSLFFQKIKKNYGYLVESAELHDNCIDKVQARLHMSFLGSSYWYWFRSIDELGEKTKEAFFSLTQSYKGSHTVLFFTSDSHFAKQYACMVEIPDKISQDEFVIFFKWLHEAYASRIEQSAQVLFAKTKGISFDVGCLLSYYACVGGPNMRMFVDTWLDRLIVPDSSLFGLSQSLFAKESLQFFKQWARIAGDYSLPFWTTFWSEQLWRASMYIQLNQAKRYSEAKKIAYRLPFHFINRDWKKYSIKELHNAHDFIYRFDIYYKRGGNAEMLDLFYAKFFLREFKI